MAVDMLACKQGDHIPHASQTYAICTAQQLEHLHKLSGFVQQQLLS